MALVGAAHAAVGAGFQQAQQLDLHGQWNVTHLIQKQRAAAGRLHQTAPGGAGARKGATLMAKQLGLKQVLGQAGAIHRHQGALGARTSLVHCTGNQFLAGARLAQQQHRGHGGRHARHQ